MKKTINKFKNKEKKKLNIPTPLRISYDMINFTKKRKINKTKKMSDFFENVKNDKKIKLPNNDNDYDNNDLHEKEIFNKLMKKKNYNTFNNSKYMTKW